MPIRAGSLNGYAHKFLIPFVEALGVGRVETRLAQREVGPGGEPFAHQLDLVVEVLGAHVQGAADREGGRLADRVPGVVRAFVHLLLDQLDQPVGGTS
jgi:hypothetical protein